MRILLAQNSLYYPAHGGGDKSNRLLIEALAERGHTCRVIARLSTFGEREHEGYLGDLAQRGMPVASASGGVVVFERHGVEVHVVTKDPHLRAVFSEQIAGFDPAVILASTDDPAQVLLEAALDAENARVVYVVRATLAVPFGPDCAFPSEQKTDLLRQADAVVGVSQYVADYVRRWSGIDAAALPISLLEPGPWPFLGRFENEFVTLVNPCAVKGVSIFLALAGRMPEIAFAAVPMWGTNERDRAALAAYPNVHLLQPVDNIDELLARTRVLLVPSLWAEARSRIVVEAMLRGVPVLASNVGGIPEAKMGVDYLLPVRPIEKYDRRLDDQMVPVADVPEQDITPWYDALRRVLTDRAHYERLAQDSRDAALAYAGGLSAGPFESFLEKVVAAPRRARSGSRAVAQAATPLETLSPEKRRLLALLLKKRSAVRPAAPALFAPDDVERSARLRLFCFPHAGGGASAFRHWSAGLPTEVAVCAARLPGREMRLSEPAFTRMQPLIDALGQTVVPHLGEPFAFFGHSMGAVVAFELARWLRTRNQRLPACLFVSSARAPQFRLHHVPPPQPSEAEFLDELRRLQAIPEEALANAEVMRVILPALRADAALYRNYVYTEGPPLEMPIRAYGGSADPNVTCAHLEAWARQTTASFGLQMFPGGHFYLDANRGVFLALLARDLAPML